MHHSIRVVIALCAVLGISACNLPRGAAIQAEITRSQDDPASQLSVVPVTRDTLRTVAKWPATGWEGRYHWLDNPRGPKSQRIESGDLIHLVIWDNQDNSLLTSTDQKSVAINQLVVSPSGSIFVPYIDQVNVLGMTPESAREEIETRIEMVVPAAQVQLTLEAGPDNSVNAVRGFSAPGNYPLPNRNYSLLSLISAAGGIDPALENPLVRLIRNGESYEIRAMTLFERPSSNVVLRGGDQVIVEEDDRYFVALGATGAQTIVPFTRERITAIEALALLGGLQASRANPQGVLILREYSPRVLRNDGTGPQRPYVVFSIDLTSSDGLFAANNFQVNPQDLVLATESPVTSVRTIFGLVGSVVGIGNALDNN